MKFLPIILLLFSVSCSTVDSDDEDEAQDSQEDVAAAPATEVKTTTVKEEEKKEAVAPVTQKIKQRQVIKAKLGELTGKCTEKRGDEKFPVYFYQAKVGYNAINDRKIKVYHEVKKGELVKHYQGDKLYFMEKERKDAVYPVVCTLRKVHFKHLAP